MYSYRVQAQVISRVKATSTASCPHRWKIAGDVWNLVLWCRQDGFSYRFLISSLGKNSTVIGLINFLILANFLVYSMPKIDSFSYLCFIFCNFRKKNYYGTKLETKISESEFGFKIQDSNFLWILIGREFFLTNSFFFVVLVPFDVFDIF